MTAYLCGGGILWEGPRGSSVNSRPALSRAPPLFGSTLRPLSLLSRAPLQRTTSLSLPLPVPPHTHLAQPPPGRRQLIKDAGLYLSDLSRTPELDVAIDGADQIDDALNCVKGGGACQTQEKVVAQAARRFVLIADYKKRVPQLSMAIPIEVLPLAHAPVMRRLAALGGAPKLRMAVAKAGPVVSDNGLFIVDSSHGALAGAGAPEALHAAIKAMAGVLETGLFLGMAHAAYIGNEDGSVELRVR